MFHAEQELQLCLKYKLYSRLGDFPPKNDLKTLASALSRFERVDVDTLFLDLLTLAYTASRYLLFTFPPEAARQAVEYVEKLLGELGCL